MSQKNYDNKAALAAKRKRRRTILHSTIGIFIITIVLVVLSVVFLRVKKFSVTGESQYSADEIINSVKASAGKSMFTVDTDELEDLVESLLPYTDNVKITKKYPTTLKIRTEPAKKAYAIELSSSFYALTTDKLKVLETSDILPDGVITVKGKSLTTYTVGKTLSFSDKAGEDPIKSALAELAQAIEDTELTGINMINIADENNICLVYDNRIIVKIGGTDNLANKLSLAKKSLDEENKLSPAQYGELDVTVNKKAVFAPDDLKDLPELVEFLGEIEERENEAALNEAESVTDNGEQPQEETAVITQTEPVTTQIIQP